MFKNTFTSLCLLLTVPSMTLNTSVAWAQETAIFQENIEELLLGAPAIADGKTEMTYYFLFLDVNGQPIENLNGKVSLGKSKANLMYSANGIYSATILPEAITKATTETLEVNARGSVTIKKSFKVQLEPPNTRTFSVSASPAEITLKQDEFVTLNIQQESGSPTSNIQISSSVGSVENVVSMGDGLFSVRYIPPQNNFPHIALFTISDSENPENRTHFVLSQKAKANFPVNATPNTNVILEITDLNKNTQRFGPVQTDSSGKASVPIIVPPGITSANLLVVDGGNTTQKVLDLRVPMNIPRVNFFPSPFELPGDGNTSYDFVVYVATPAGNPDNSATLLFKAEHGRIGKTIKIGDGLYKASYLPDVQESKTTDNIKVTLQAATGDIDDNHIITLLPVLPEKITLTPDNPVLKQNIPDFSIIAHVEAQNGKGLDGRTLDFTQQGAKLLQIKPLSSGDYSVKFAPTGNGPIEITSSIKGSTSQNHPFGIGAKSNHAILANDGISSSIITFVVYDEFGSPVANQKLELSIPNGNGSVPPQVTTNSAGVAQIVYTAGTKAGMAQIQVTSGQLQSTIGILLAPKNSNIKIDTLPVSENNIHARLQSQFFKSITNLRLEREGLEGSPLQSAMEKIGAPSQIRLHTEPVKVVVGGKFDLKISVTDENGRGVAGEELTILASSGTIGRKQDLGNGQYSVMAIAPEDPGSVTMVVQSANGQISTELSIEVLDAPGRTNNVASNDTLIPDNTDSPTPSDASADNGTEKAKNETKVKEPKVKEPKVKEPKVKEAKTPSNRDAVDPVWIRASVGFVGGFYSYQQVPTSTTGPLYGQGITFNKQTEGSSPAQTAGFDARIKGYVPNLEYVGYDLHIHSDQYSVILEEFPDAINDWISNIDFAVIGQYPIALDGWKVTPGIRAGFLRDDLMIYQQDILDDGQIQLSYAPLFVNCLNLGAGVNVESDLGLFINGMYDMGLQGNIYRHKLDSQVGYSLNNGLFVFTGMRSTVRNVDIDSGTDKVGELHDGHKGFVFGLGYGR